MQANIRLGEANVRLEAMWPFPMWHAGEWMAEVLETDDDNLSRLPEPIRTLISDWTDEAKDNLLGGEGPEFMEAFDNLNEFAIFRNVSGWLALVACPVPERDDDGRVRSFSWGHYRLELLFADTPEALLEQAAEWGEALFDGAEEEEVAT